MILQLSFNLWFIYTITLFVKNHRQKSTVSKRHHAPPNNVDNYTPLPIIVSYLIAIGPTTSDELRSQSITILKTLKFYNSYKNYWNLNQNGRIIWSTIHHNQSSYQIWKLSDQRHQRSCLHKVKRVGQTENLYAPILLYAGHGNYSISTLAFRISKTNQV